MVIGIKYGVVAITREILSVNFSNYMAKISKAYMAKEMKTHAKPSLSKADKAHEAKESPAHQKKENVLMKKLLSKKK